VIPVLLLLILLAIVYPAALIPIAAIGGAFLALVLVSALLGL
jgi:hypothetical protein